MVNTCFTFASLTIIIYQFISIYAYSTSNQCNSFPLKDFKQIWRKVCTGTFLAHQEYKKCPYPNDNQIQIAFKKYSNIFNVVDLLGIPEVREKFANIPLRAYSMVNINETIGQTGCLLKNITRPNEASVCPYHYVVQYRPDKIPNFRRQAICNCPRCHAAVQETVNDNEHRCTNVMKVALMLELGKCVKTFDGYDYELNLAFEEISIACECMLAPDSNSN
jgi:hypothetical protein